MPIRLWINNIERATLESIDALATRLFNDATPAVTSLEFREPMESFGDLEASSLAEMLKNNRTLTKLSIGCSSIEDFGAQALAGALRMNSSITKFEIGIDNIGGAGIEAFTDALSENKTVKDFSFTDSALGESAADRELGAKLATMLERNTTLKTLAAWGCKIGSAGVATIAEAMKKNTPLENLNLIGNEAGDDGVKAIATMLRENNTLKALGLACNNVGNAGALSLLAAMSEGGNATLTGLSFDSNNITEDVVISTLSDAIKRNRENISPSTVVAGTYYQASRSDAGGRSTTGSRGI